MGDILQRDTLDMSKLGYIKKKIYEAVEKNKNSVYKLYRQDFKNIISDVSFSWK